MTVVLSQELQDLDSERVPDTAICNALAAWWHIWQYGTREEVTDAHEQLARSCEAFFTLKGENYGRER